MLWDESTDDLILEGAARLGLGTTPTEAILDIRGGNEQHLYIQGTNSGVGALARIKTTAGGRVLTLETGTTSDSRDILKCKNSSGTVFNLQANGQVCIGAETPASTLDVRGTVQVGVDDAGHDVKFFGATSGRYIQWDESANILTGLYDQRIGVNRELKFGLTDASLDYLRIYTVGAGGSYIKSHSSDLTIQCEKTDGNIYFQNDNGSGGEADYFIIDGSNLRTTVYKDFRFNDGIKLNIGTGNDLQLIHDGTHSYISNTEGTLFIGNSAPDKDIVFSCDDSDGGTEIYFFLDGSLGGGTPYTVFPDSSVLSLGSGNDLQIQHDSNNSYITSNGIGDLIIEQLNNDKDIIFKGDDGAGNLATYFYLDGSYSEHGIDGQTHTPSTVFPDHALLALGTHRDLKIWYNNVRGRIAYTGGNEFQISALNNFQIGFNDSDGVYGETALVCYKNGKVQIRHDNATKFETSTDGISITGGIDLTGELNFLGGGNKVLDVETLASSNTFKIRHYNPSGNLFEDAAVFTANAGAELHYNHSKKFETTSTGAKVTGNLEVDGITKQKVYTVANLPTPSAGDRAFISDSAYGFSSSYLGSQASGGGSNFSPVYSDGAYWYMG